MNQSNDREQESIDVPMHKRIAMGVPLDGTKGVYEGYKTRGNIAEDGKNRPSNHSGSSIRHDNK